MKHDSFETVDVADPVAGAGAYLARDRLLSLCSAAPLPESTHGVALLADIANFTSLTELLHASHGPRDGAEVLISYTNQVYAQLIEQAHAHGGSVIDFAGDAILCWFDGACETTLLRAVAAGLAMLASAPACAAPAPAAWRQHFALKVSIAAGPARRMAPGHPKYGRLDSIAGTAINRLAGLEPLLQPGALVVDRDSLAPVRHRLRWDASLAHVVTGLRVDVAPIALTPPAPLPPHLLRQWLPAPVRRQLAHAGHPEFGCEIRRAVVVFLRFARRDYQHEADAARLLERLVRHTQEVAQRFGGHLLQLSLSDKGNYLYLVFGAPIARENAAGRAIRAALALLAPSPASAPFGILAGGIASGYARIGSYGAPQRRAYGVIGGPVNLAARLMEAARPGELLAPAWLAGAVSGAPASARGALTLKGMAAPCEVVCLGAEAHERGPAPAPGGAVRSHHGAALRALEQRLDGLQRGAGAALLVEGAPGIGKTVLLHTLADAARARGIVVVASAVNEFEQTSLYAPWRRVFAALFASDAALATELAALDNGLARAAPLVMHALHRGAPAGRMSGIGAGAHDSAAQLRAQLTREALAALVDAQARRAPLLLVLDDAHWFDSASLSLLAMLARADLPLMLLVAARDGSAGAGAVAARLGLADGARLPLAPLPAPALLAVASARVKAAAMSAEAGAFVLDKSGGNPFFAEQLVLSLKQLGHLYVTHGLCQLSAAGGAGSAILPDSIEEVITARLDRLTARQLHLTKLASALDGAFDARLVAGLAAAAAGDDAPPPAAIDAGLAELHALEILAPVSDTPGSYRFRDTLVRDVAYHLMLASQRSLLHRWLALRYETAGGDRLDALLPVLARHWQQVAADPAADADALARAIGLLHRAALQAVRAHALGEAARHLQYALPLLARGPDSSARVCLETELQALLGYCLSTQRGFGDAAVEQAYRRGYALAQLADPTPSLGFSLYGLFSFYASRAEYAPAQRLAAQMLQLGQSSGSGGGDAALCAFAHHSMGISAFLAGEPDAARASLARSDALCDALAPADFLGFANELPLFNGAWHILALASSGRVDAARQRYAAVLSASAHAPHAQAFVLCFAMLPVWERDFEATLHACDRLDALSQRHGFDLYAAAARVYRGWTLALRGDDGAGAALAAGALPLLRAVQLNSFLPLFLALAAEAQLSAGDTDAAAAMLAEARAAERAAGAGFCSARLAHLQRQIPSPRRTAVTLPLPPQLQPNPAPVPRLAAYWHAIALCTPFDGAAVTVAEVWLDSTAGVMRVLQCRLDGAYLDMLFAGGQAWILESEGGSAPWAAIGPFPSGCVVPDSDWFGRQSLRSPGRGRLLGVECDWWVGLTTCHNPINPDNPPAPTDQVGNWFWFDSASALPLQMMFINSDNSYRLPILGEFAKVTFTRSDQIADPGLAALLARCADARPAPPGASVADGAGRAPLMAAQPGMAARLLPGLRLPDAGDRLPVWAERLYLSSFTIATYDSAPNAPYPTQVYYEAGPAHMLTRLQLQDGSQEDCILDAGSTHVVRRWSDGRHQVVAQLPVGLPYRDWLARDGAGIVAAIDRHPLFFPDGTLLLISAPSDHGRVFWIWYSGDGVPLSFLEAPQCANVQLVLTEYAAMALPDTPFDPALFVVPAAQKEPAHGA